MEPQTDHKIPVDTGPQSQQALHGNQPSERATAGSHGSSGEGSGSAMARLISQEKARIVPGAPEDGLYGSS